MELNGVPGVGPMRDVEQRGAGAGLRDATREVRRTQRQPVVSEPSNPTRMFDAARPPPYLGRHHQRLRGFADDIGCPTVTGLPARQAVRCEGSGRGPTPLDDRPQRPGAALGARLSSSLSQCTKTLVEIDNLQWPSGVRRTSFCPDARARSTVRSVELDPSDY